MTTTRYLSLCLLVLLGVGAAGAAEEQRQVFRLKDGRELYGYVVERDERRTVIMSEIRSEEEGIIRARMSVDSDDIASAVDTDAPPPAIGERITPPTTTTDDSRPPDEQELARQEQRRLQQEDRIARARASVAEAENKLRGFTERRQRLSEGFDAARKLHAQLNEQLAATRKTLGTLEAKADRETEYGGSANPETWSRIERARAESTRLLKDIAAVEAETRAAHAEVGRVESQRQQLERALRSMHLRLAQLQEKLTAMDSEQEAGPKAATDGPAAPPQDP